MWATRCSGRRTASSARTTPSRTTDREALRTSFAAELRPLALGDVRAASGSWRPAHRLVGSDLDRPHDALPTEAGNGPAFGPPFWPPVGSCYSARRPSAVACN